MKTALLVLWVYSASGFNLGYISTGPGWWSTKHIFTQDQYAACQVLGMHMEAARSAVTDYGCWAEGDAPPEEDWAKVKR